MVRTGRIPALAIVAWLAGIACCAAEATFLQPPSPPFPPQEMSLDEPPPESWPAGSIEPRRYKSVEEWLEHNELSVPPPPSLPSLPPVPALPRFPSLRSVCSIPLLLPAIPIWKPDLSLAPPATRTFGPGYSVSGTSWLNRPWYAGGFFGPMFGDSLIDSHVDQDVGIATGARVGYDLDYYFAVESSITWVSAGIDDNVAAPPGRDVQSWYFDGSMVLYPWGDSQWRPFYAIGAGAGHFRFEDAAGAQYRETLFQVPLSIGVKYLYDRWFALRAELTHHIVFSGAGIDAMDNFAATAGFEIRYGASPRSYFPW